jgi:hypothetical protein
VNRDESMMFRFSLFGLCETVGHRLAPLRQYSETIFNGFVLAFRNTSGTTGWPVRSGRKSAARGQSFRAHSGQTPPRGVIPRVHPRLDMPPADCLSLSPWHRILAADALNISFSASACRANHNLHTRVRRRVNKGDKGEESVSQMNHVMYLK